MIYRGEFFGCPSVARRVGGIPEVVDDKVSGRLVDSADPGALARVVEELIAQPEQRQALGQAAQRRARENFSAGVIVPLYEKLYEQVCRGITGMGVMKGR